jgi:hypothetical protein
MQQGFVPAPQSSDLAWLAKHPQLFIVELAASEVAALGGLDRPGQRASARRSALRRTSSPPHFRKWLTA